MWHVEAGTAEKRAEVGMLTAILPYRVGTRESWTATNRRGAAAELHHQLTACRR